MWRISYFVRVEMGIGLLALVVLNSAIRELISTLFRSRDLRQTHYIAQYEQRFAELHHFLPPNQTIFYVDDFNKSSDQCDAFYLAQYSLAPTVLVAFNSQCGSPTMPPSHDSRLLVENFHDTQGDSYLVRFFPIQYFATSPPTDQLILASMHPVLLRDFGHGLRLYSLSDK